MKNFRFALRGMVVILCLLCSCSHGEKESAGQVVTEEDVMDDKAADKETPGNDEEENPGTKPDLSLPEDDEEDSSGPTEEEPAPSSSDKEGTDKESAEDDPSIPEETSKFLVLQINELRTEYANPKAEFIEFKILSAGNLSGVRVFVASNYKNPLIYEFAPVEVKKGEYVVLHLRTMDEASSVNEYGNNLSESGGADSSAHARDFWIPGKEKLLRKTDIVYVLDNDDNIMDAVLIAEKPDLVWPTLSKQDCFPAVAEFLFNNGAWKSADGGIPAPQDAVSSANTSQTQTICRDEAVKDTNTAADWYIAAKSCLTPGMKNNPKRL